MSYHNPELFRAALLVVWTVISLLIIVVLLGYNWRRK